MSSPWAASTFQSHPCPLNPSTQHILPFPQHAAVFHESLPLQCSCLFLYCPFTTFSIANLIKLFEILLKCHSWESFSQHLQVKLIVVPLHLSTSVGCHPLCGYQSSSSFLYPQNLAFACKEDSQYLLAEWMSVHMLLEGFFSLIIQQS